MDILLLSIFGVGITGIYSLAYNLVRVLVKLIQSFWQSVYPTLSRLYHQSSHKYPILNGLSLRYGLMILLPTAALCTGVADDIIHLIYGREYEEASAVLQVLIWQAPFLFVETYAVHDSHGRAPRLQKPAHYGATSHYTRNRSAPLDRGLWSNGYSVGDYRSVSSRNDHRPHNTSTD